MATQKQNPHDNDHTTEHGINDVHEDYPGQRITGPDFDTRDREGREDEPSTMCPFCYSLSHTNVRECPNIDPEQLAEELVHLAEKVGLIHSNRTVHGVSVCGEEGPLTAEWSEVTCSECFELREEEPDAALLAEVRPHPEESERDCSDEEITGAVALQLADLDARDEHTGGGIYCVYIPEPTIPGTEWCFGMACKTWAGDLVEADDCCLWGEVEGTSVHLYTDVPSEDRHAPRVAEAIRQVITEWRVETHEKGGAR